ncbi:hypothetical protein F2Q69_00001500 [Brassica cretica]|uniref:Uncharacterized protein n=1 Tax=Brassica cretica TaxID=69181 RepID=A0A8S9P1P5_BRACR|nr:hypothetical protein F2Q69_00001500 [Brassica cretica]
MPLRKTATESASTIAVSLTRYTLPLRNFNAETDSVAKLALARSVTSSIYGV